jgi:glycosyltransferase involved in cell wall biosynthesis
MSEKVKEDLLVFAPNKPTVFIPHPLYDNFGEKISKDLARKHLNIETDAKIILFFGFIRKYKGLDILLDSIKILQQSNPTLKLLIAGEFYDDEKSYKEQIDKLGIEQQLILRTNFINDNEVKYYLCASDVIVQPYRSATQSGVTPLAYHFEIPMIVTNVGGLAALVPDNKVGLIAEPNAASIAEKIIQFFNNSEQQYLPFLKEEKKKYSWSKMVEAIMSIATF